MTEQDKRALRLAVSALNEYGREAANYLSDLLGQPGNEEADAWLASLWEPVTGYAETRH
jgi:hypothetical protein